MEGEYCVDSDLDTWCEGGLGQQGDACGGSAAMHAKYEGMENSGAYVDDCVPWPFLLGSCVLSDYPSRLWRLIPCSGVGCGMGYPVVGWDEVGVIHCGGMPLWDAVGVIPCGWVGCCYGMRWGLSPVVGCDAVGVIPCGGVGCRYGMLWGLSPVVGLDAVMLGLTKNGSTTDFEAQVPSI